MKEEIKNIEWFIYGAYPNYKVAAKTKNFDMSLIDEIVNEKIKKFGNIGNIPDTNKKNKFLGIFPCKNPEYYGILYVHLVEPIKLENYNIKDKRNFFCFHCFLLKKEDVEKFHYNPFYLKGLELCPSNKGKIEKVLKNANLKISIKNNFNENNIIKLIGKESLEKLKREYYEIYDELEKIILKKYKSISLMIQNMENDDKVVIQGGKNNWEQIEDFFKYLFSNKEISKKLENIGFITYILSSESSFNLGGGVPGIIYSRYEKILFPNIKREIDNINKIIEDNIRKIIEDNIRKIIEDNIRNKIKIEEEDIKRKFKAIINTLEKIFEDNNINKIIENNIRNKIKIEEEDIKRKFKVIIKNNINTLKKIIIYNINKIIENIILKKKN